MTSDSENEQVFSSNTWTWQTRKIRSAPQATRQRGRSPHRWIGCYSWPRSKKLTVTLTYRGGPEGWVLVEARGRHGVFSGDRAILDILCEVMVF